MNPTKAINFRKNRLLIIGPVRPTRGGIAKHTENLVSSLSSTYHCSVLAETRLFPKFLYPGKTEIGLEPSILNRAEVEVLRASFGKNFKRLLLLDRTQIAGLVLIWWSAGLSYKFLLYLFLAKLKGIRVVVFCHNVAPHNNSRLESLITRFCLSKADRLAVQTESDARIVRAYPGKQRKIHVTPHPPYPTNSEHESIKTDDKPVRFLYFGIIRPYKGVETLVNAAGLLAEYSYELRIVGESWDRQLTNEILNRTRFDAEHVTARLEFVDEETISREFIETDFVILPYLSASGSGVLALAKAYKKAVIVSDIESFKKEVVDGVDGFFFEAGNSSDLARVMRMAAAGANSKKLKPWENLAHTNSWDSLASSISKMIAD